MSDIKEKLARRKRRTATVDICLRGDLAGEYEQLEKQLAELPGTNKLAGDPDKTRITAEMDRVRGEMTADTITFTLHALSDKAYQRLVDEHPPRRDGDDINVLDAELGYDRSTFSTALVRASTVEPALDDDDWELLFGEDGMSAGQKMQLRMEATRVNAQAVDVPFSPDASKPTPG